MITIEANHKEYTTRFDRKPILLETPHGIILINEILRGVKEFVPYALILTYSLRQNMADGLVSGSYEINLGENLPNPFIFEHVYGITSFDLADK